MSSVQFVSQNRWFPKLQKTKYPSPQSYCFWHTHAQTLRLAHSSYIALKLKSLWEIEEIEFIWELISYSLIGVSDTWPGPVKLFFPSYKVLSNLSLHFELAPCPILTVPYSQHPERSLLSHLFAFAYAIPIGKPLSFIVCLAHFLRCGSGGWEAVCDHCLHWSGVDVLLGRLVSTLTWYFVSCLVAVTCLSYHMVSSWAQQFVFLSLCSPCLAANWSSHEN